ncbi:uncharacterized protein LOC120124029 [Hibiscus syriacus]|uniref:uncharacterized protein LOC120124029 n=1 Tax=Hibiscus syriacus TaxID=106335 RepID=UPI001924391A|nr:uncharacterized protein LOC120124029 [Hibiscus syriacus]
MRLTHSATREGAVSPNKCIDVKICTDDQKRRISGNKNKLCHSTVRQENEILANEEENISTPFTDSGPSERNIAIPENNVSAMERTKSKKKKMPLHHVMMDWVLGVITARRERKVVNTNKQGRRFSPQNLEPRTRSQTRSHPRK